MPARLYLPLSSVSIVLTAPLSVFISVIVTPGRMPPCASVTIPVITAFETCAGAVTGQPTSNASGSSPIWTTRLDERINVASITRPPSKEMSKMPIRILGTLYSETRIVDSTDFGAWWALLRGGFVEALLLSINGGIILHIWRRDGRL